MFALCYGKQGIRAYLAGKEWKLGDRRVHVCTLIDFILTI